MKHLSPFIVPLVIFCGSSASAMTVAQHRLQGPASTNGVVSRLASVDIPGRSSLVGKASIATGLHVILVADARDEKVASVEAPDLDETKRSIDATRATLSVPPEEIPSRCDLGGPTASLTPGGNPLSSPPSRDKFSQVFPSDVLVGRSMPPVVEHEGSLSLANEATMMTPGDSTGPVLRTQLASLDQGFMGSMPAPITVPDTPITPSIVRRKPEERFVTSSVKSVGPHKALVLKTAKVAPSPVPSQASLRSHVARLKMIRPNFDASTTSVSETAQIAGLRAMERMQ